MFRWLAETFLYLLEGLSKMFVDCLYAIKTSESASMKLFISKTSYICISYIIKYDVYLSFYNELPMFWLAML